MIYELSDTKTDEYISRVNSLISGKNKRVTVITFGCQQNEADSEKILGFAEKMGYSSTDDYTESDLIIVNTCAIREHAELKALSMLGRFKALKEKNPGLIVGVVGCMAAEPHRAQMIKQDFHYVSFTLEPNMLHRIPEMVARRLIDGKRSFVFGEDRGDVYEGAPIVRRGGHRAWVSIMYGCNNFCSYCIVPYVRGRERSRRSEDVISECKRLVSDGVREITLLGQNVNSYCSDMDFATLLSRIAEIEGNFIIRFMTSHPKDTSDALIDVMAAHSPKIAPFFHLPMQSGSDRILKAMNRTYTKDAYLSVAKKLKEKIPGIALSTDVIIGFPGETDTDFEETIDVLETVRFDMVYPFFYSKREGTVAAKMDGEVSREQRGERMSRLLKLQDDISLENNLKHENEVLRVLVDKIEITDGIRLCTARSYSNKIVTFESEDACVGDFKDVKIVKAHPFSLTGEQIKK